MVQGAPCLDGVCVMVSIMTMLPLLLGFLSLAKISAGNHDFSYDGTHGPSHWPEEFQSCVGKHQSPINIEEHNVRNVSLSPLKFSGLATPRTSFITNNGHTVMITTNESVAAIVTQGPLGNNSYAFEQLHFHWGENDHEGSEDLINNHSFAMELHAVFYKMSYKSMSEAMKHPDGLAVLAYFYEAVDKQNPTYNAIVAELPTIEMVGKKKKLREPLLLEKLLIPNVSTIQNYFTYNGSLTTPPCSEVVTWIDFKDPQLLSHKQLAAFRNVRNSDGKKLTHNFRPVQPLADRLVFHNIPDAGNKKPTKAPIDSHRRHGREQHAHGSGQIKTSASIFILFSLLLISI